MDLVIFTGLPGSGKSFFYRTHFEKTHLHVSKDLIPNTSNRDRKQQKLIEEALSQGKSVVIDNTNPRVSDRAPLIELGRRFQAKIIGYFFDCTTKECVERNRKREGKARVPDVAIYVASKRLQKPEFSEGFDQLFSVHLTPALTFEVKPL